MRWLQEAETLDAAAASRSSSELPTIDGVNKGRDGRVDTAVVAVVVVEVRPSLVPRLPNLFNVAREKRGSLVREVT